MSEHRTGVEVGFPAPLDTPMVASVTISVPVAVTREPRNEVDMRPFVARCPDLALSPRGATPEEAVAAVKTGSRAALLAGQERAERRAGGRG